MNTMAAMMFNLRSDMVKQKTCSHPPMAVGTVSEYFAKPCVNDKDGTYIEHTPYCVKCGRALMSAYRIKLK